MTLSLSHFARGLTAETAFDVLAVARSLKARRQGRHRAADRRQSLSQHAARPRRRHRRPSQDGATHYCPSPGLPSFRETRRRATIGASSASPIGPENVVVGAGRQGLRAVLLRGVPRPRRRRAGLHAALPDLRPEHRAPRRPDRLQPAAAGEPVPARPQRRGALPQDAAAGQGDLPQLAAQPDRRRGDGGRPARPGRPGARPDIAVFSDEPYCHMVWEGRHETLAGPAGHARPDAWRRTPSASRTA